MSSINQETLDRIKMQLSQAKSLGGSVPQDLFSHLAEVFNRIIIYHQEDAYEKFEEISALVKQTNLKFKNPKSAGAVNSQAGERRAEVTEWVTKSKNLLNEVS